jgi:hypothetical protein
MSKGCGSNLKPTSIAAVSFGGMGICPNEFCTNANFLFYEINKIPKQVVD